MEIGQRCITRFVEAAFAVRIEVFVGRSARPHLILLISLDDWGARVRRQPRPFKAGETRVVPQQTGEKFIAGLYVLLSEVGQSYDTVDRHLDVLMFLCRVKEVHYLRVGRLRLHEMCLAQVKTVSLGE